MENKPLIYFHAMQILVERKLLDHGAHGRFIVAADGVNQPPLRSLLMT